MAEPVVHRRAVLTSTASLVLLAGCDLGGGPSSAPSTPPPVGTTPSLTAGPADADGATVVAVATLISRARGDAAAAVRAYPSLSAVLQPFVRLHDVHLRQLDDGDPRREPRGLGGRPPATARAARADVLARERALQRTLASTASRVDSGALALLLASMAAGLAQQRASGPDA